jgi:hypothetical protein
VTHETGDVRQVIEQAWRDGYDFGQADAGFDVCDANDAWTRSGTFRDLAQLTAQPAPSATKCEGGITVRWCPRCGTCTCPRTDNPEEWETDAFCPIHGDKSSHEEETETQPAPSGWQRRIERLVGESFGAGIEWASSDAWLTRRVNWPGAKAMAARFIAECGQNAVDALPPESASTPLGCEPHLTVADLRGDPEDEASTIESHDVHFTMGNISLLVNIQGGSGFAWALTSRDGKIDEHGSKNTDQDGAYRALPPAPEVKD